MLFVLVFIRVSVVFVVLLPYAWHHRMAKTLDHATLRSRTTRSSVARRREPHWVVLSKGCALGYRRLATDGTWIARFHDVSSGRRHHQALGAADDVLDADEQVVFSFDGAQKRARSFFRERAREISAGVLGGIYTVDQALTDYLRHYEGKKGVDAAEWTRVSIDAHIRPVLGKIAVSKLTARCVKEWHHDLASSAPRRASLSAVETERVRKRRASANRALTVLLAALNLAFRDRIVPNDDDWRSVKKFSNVDVARVRYLDKEEALRLLRGCLDHAFRDLVRGALLTSRRYSERTARVNARSCGNGSPQS
jgi:hypothetical protein